MAAILRAASSSTNEALFTAQQYMGGTGNGTVFKLAPPTSSGGQWTETVLHNFGYGESPSGSLTLDARGALYGTAYGGGSHSSVVFKLTPPSFGIGPWSTTVLYSFTGGADGEHPGRLIFDKQGVLYGTTGSWGSSNLGTVYKLTPPRFRVGPWAKTVLKSFSGLDGNIPGGVLFEANGAIYGATAAGGSLANGVVFKLTPPSSSKGSWTETVITDFTGTRLASPNTLVLDATGTLYGTTTISERGGPQDYDDGGAPV